MLLFRLSLSDEDSGDENIPTGQAWFRIVYDGAIETLKVTLIKIKNLKSK